MSFNEKCYSALKKVPQGKVTTYAELGRAVGSPKSARAVGNAMNKNKNREVPCHRVVRSDGSIGGFAFGSEKKTEMLKKEGVEIVGGKMDLDKFGFRFSL